MKNNITKIEKKIVITEIIFIAGILVYLFFSTAPNQIYPFQGMTISEPNFNIEIENGEQVFISTDENFTNPIALGEGSEIILPPGIYYWKVKSKLRESKVKSFVIKTNVGLNLKEREKNYELQNSGNVDLNVTKKKEGITSSMALDVGELKKVEKDNSKYEGRQK